MVGKTNFLSQSIAARVGKRFGRHAPLKIVLSQNLFDLIDHTSARLPSFLTERG